MACTGLKKGSFHLFRHPNGLESFLHKHRFDPFLTHFWSQNNPFLTYLMTFEGPKWLAMGLK